MKTGQSVHIDYEYLKVIETMPMALFLPSHTIHRGTCENRCDVASLSGIYFVLLLFISHEGERKRVRSGGDDVKRSAKLICLESSQPSSSDVYFVSSQIVCI